MISGTNTSTYWTVKTIAMGDNSTPTATLRLLNMVSRLIVLRSVNALISISKILRMLFAKFTKIET